MGVDTYIRRFLERVQALDIIGENGEITLNLENLRRIHFGLISNAPFENLSMHTDGIYCLNIDALYNKVVVNRRGGFCVELNGLLGHMLQLIGYPVAFLPAQVNRGHIQEEFNGIWTDWTHIFLLVDVPSEENPKKIDQYFLDAAFGTHPAGPVKFVLDEEQVLLDGYRYRFTVHDEQLSPRPDFTGTPFVQPCRTFFAERYSATRATWVPRLGFRMVTQPLLFPRDFVPILVRVLGGLPFFLHEAPLATLIPDPKTMIKLVGRNGAEVIALPSGSRTAITFESSEELVDFYRTRFGLPVQVDSAGNVCVLEKDQHLPIIYSSKLPVGVREVSPDNYAMMICTTGSQVSSLSPQPSPTGSVSVGSTGHGAHLGSVSSPSSLAPPSQVSPTQSPISSLSSLSKSLVLLDSLASTLV